MVNNESKLKTIFSKNSYVWYVTAVVFMMFANGKYIVPVAIWLGLVFSLRFTRERKPAAGYIIMVFTIALIYIFQWYDAWKVLPFFYLLPITVGVFGALPFLIDRLLLKRYQGFLSVFVFPLVWTAGEFFNSFGVSASLGSLAYTQYGNLPLMQLVSITGLWGITFLITWFAAVVNYSWERQFEWQKIYRVVGVYVCVFALIMIYGGTRLVFQNQKPGTVRIASVVVPGMLAGFFEAIETKVVPSFDKSVQALTSYTNEAVKTGAEIILFHEYAFLIDANHEKAFTELAGELAKKENIHLFLSLGVFGPSHGENKVLYFKPSGETGFEYLKFKPVMSVETPYITSGSQTGPTIDTPFGKIATVICADLSYNHYIKSVGENGAGLLLGPSNEWKELVPWDTYMAVFRAIENGFSMVRANGEEGISIAVDPLGQTLSSMNSLVTNKRIMISDVPVKRVATLYSIVGELFGFLCMIGSGAIVGWAIVKRHT